MPADAVGDRARWMLAKEGVDDDFLRGTWETAARRLGGGRLVEVMSPQEHQLDLLIEVTADRRFWLLVAVAPDPPHVLTRWGTAPALPVGIELRRAETDDGPGLVALERDAPVVVGDVAPKGNAAMEKDCGTARAVARTRGRPRAAGPRCVRPARRSPSDPPRRVRIAAHAGMGCPSGDGVQPRRLRPLDAAGAAGAAGACAVDRPGDLR